MAQKTLPAISEKPAITIKALRDLVMEGWERKEVSIKSRNDQSIMVQLMGEVLQITCMEDAELSLPFNSVINVDKVGGDGEFRHLEGILNIQSINGDATFSHLKAPIVARQIGGDAMIEDVSSVQIEKISGDVTGNGMSGPLSIRQVGGDARLTRISSAQVDKISGDCQIKDLSGDLTLQKTGGDFSCKNLQGNLAANHISGDFHIEMVQGNMVITTIGGDCEVIDFAGGITVATTSGDFTGKNIQGSLKVDRVSGDAVLQHNSALTRVNAGGDISASLESGSSLDCNLQAGGDLSVALNPNHQASVKITSNGQDISIDFGKEKLNLSQRSYQASIGSPSIDQSKTVELVFTAGGDVSITDKLTEGDAASSNSAAWTKDFAQGNFGQSFSEGFNFNPFDAEKFASSIRENVTRQVDEATRMVEQQVKEAMKQVDGINLGGFNQFIRPPRPGMSVPGMPPIPPANPFAQPVNPEKAGITDEERLMILNMVKDQKISIEEAEKLLQALEGQDR